MRGGAAQEEGARYRQQTKVSEIREAMARRHPDECGGHVHTGLGEVSAKCAPRIWEGGPMMAGALP